MFSDEEYSLNPFNDTEKKTELSHKVEEIYTENDQATPDTAQKFHYGIMGPTFRALVMFNLTKRIFFDKQKISLPYEIFFMWYCFPGNYV